MRLALLIGTCALLWSFESAWPLQRYRGSRLRRRLPNVALTVLVVLLNLALSFAVAAVAGTGELTLLNVFLGIATLDLATYTAHVVLHKSSFAWRFHRVHHSENEVDGLPFSVVVLYLTLSTLNAQLEHANLRVPERLDRVLRLLFVTPNMHKVHHSRAQRETDLNYANIFSIWDRLFGTYTRNADLATLRYGLDGFDEPRRQNLRGLLGMPWDAGWKACATPIMLVLTMSMLAGDAPKRTVLFMCPYGGAKSVIAMSYFNRLAERDGLPFVAAAVSAETPYDAVPENVAAFLSREGFSVESFDPRHVTPEDLESAAKVVSIDCDLTKLDTRRVTIEHWDDVPKVSVDLPGSASAIRKHVETLVKQLESER